MHKYTTFYVTLSLKMCLFLCEFLLEQNRSTKSNNLPHWNCLLTGWWKVSEQFKVVEMKYKESQLMFDGHLFETKYCSVVSWCD